MPNGLQPDESSPTQGLWEILKAGGSAVEIGHFRLIDKLGEGRMGVVFRALHLLLSKLIALRILPPSLTRDPSAMRRFRRDAETIARIDHPNIIAIYELFDERGVYVLAMKHVEGRGLDQLVRERGPERFVSAIEFLIQVAGGLGALHEQGIFHHHIKPSSLILDDSGTVRILGLPRIVEVSTDDPETADYRAPELAEDPRRADHRADIYSLGCTLYFLMTGRAPFAGETIPERRTSHRDQPVPSLCAARPDAPASLEVAFQRMMAKRPEDRPQSMTEVITLLEACNSSAFEALATGTDPSRDAFFVDDRPEMPVRPPTIERGIKARTSQPEPPLLLRRKLPRLAGRPTVVLVLVALALLTGALMRSLSFKGAPDTDSQTSSQASQDSKGDVAAVDARQKVEAVPSLPVPEQVVQTIFDSKSNRGWMLTNRKPLPPNRIQPDGLNPHGTGSYLVVYEKKLGDFVLDFDYKLSRGCNSGVFLRVGDLGDPVNTGIEVALEDTTGTSYVDSGAFYDLVAPDADVQNPAGQWNHMTITADGPILAVSLNGKAVSRINLDEWTVAGKRPDGSDHKFKKRPLADLPRTGYLGFQDHGRDCWFRTITLKTRGKS
jgi:serine/threonine protein kinase